MSDIAIRVEGLSKQFRIGSKQEKYKTLRDTLTAAVASPFRAIGNTLRRSKEEHSSNGDNIWALKDVSFEIKRGEVVGIIGRNGAGKSTLLKILSRIIDPTEGYADIHGRIGSLLEVGTGFHPELTGRENIYLNGAILGMRRAEIERKFDEMVAFAEVSKFIDTPVKHYSTGMHMRLAFAVAAHLDPEILLVDEVLAVGDAAFQKKCLGKMGEAAQSGRTVLLVSHNMGAIRSFCTKGVLLHDGQVIEAGDVGKSIESYYRSIGALQNDAPGESSGANGQGRSRFGWLSLNGSQGNTVSQSQPFDVSLPLRIDEGVSGFSLYCILEDMQNRLMFHLREDSRDLGFKSVPPGGYNINVNFPALWLNPGLYSLYFKVFFLSERSASARYVSDVFPLDIVGATSSVDCALNPQTTWSVEKR